MRTKLKYHCGFCGNDFEQEVGTSFGGNHSKVSTQVKCSGCGNFLKTWEGI